MKTIIKKMMAVMLVAGVLQLVIPAKKAEAGIVAAGITMIFAGGNDVDSALSQGGMMVFGVGFVLGAITHGFGGGTGWLIMLDADGNMNQDQMAQNLAARYDFIDNSEVINGLAATIKTKFPSELKLDDDQSYYVSLSENETRATLAGADLSEEEIAFVANDLK